MAARIPPRGAFHIRDVVGSPRRTIDVLLPTTSGGYIATWCHVIGDVPAWSQRFGMRLRAALLVLRGQAVALQWPWDGELELAYFGKQNEPLRQAVQPVPVEDVDLVPLHDAATNTGDAA